MQLNEQTLKHSALGAAILTCGIGSEARLEQSMGMGRTALNMGALRLANLDELDDDETVISASVVGRALDKNGKLTIELREVFRSVELLLETEERRPRAVINGHPGGFLHWLLAAYFDLDVLDAYANGRGHPTLAMGGLGLARPGSASTRMTSYGSLRDGSSEPFKLYFEGNLGRAEELVRYNALRGDGAAAIARGPYKASFLRRTSAKQMVQFEAALGERAWAAGDAQGRIDAITDFIQGTELLRGEVVNNHCKWGGGYSSGFIEVDCSGSDTRVGVVNEFMSVDIDGRRVATFPDLIIRINPETGMPVSIIELQAGSKVLFLHASSKNYPTGAGVRDASVFPLIEELLGIEIGRYALS